MAKVLIIADDLTGAADCAAVFAQRGWATRVHFADPDRCDAAPDDWHDEQVVSIDTNTRSAPPGIAAACVARLVREYARLGSGREAVAFFKKVDSTLRGNVGAELAAALEACREGWAGTWMAVFAPAFPAFGRTTVHGRQLVHGKALKDSDEWQRERMVPESDIAAMLRAAGLRCVQVGLEAIRADGADLKRWMRGASSAADVVIWDAESDADLQVIVQRGMELGIRILWAGSAGLAHPVAAATAMALPTLKPGVREVRGPALYVVGSPAPVSEEQARALAGAGDVHIFTFAPTELLRDGKTSHRAESARRIGELLAGGKDVLVRCDPRERCSAEDAQKVAESLARIVGPCARHVGALVATGGETARAILDELGVRQLRLVDEVEPGLPCSVARCEGREVLILTKAGGFGTRETLIRCREFIRSRSVSATVTQSIRKPIIAITMGDAAGVGPEIIVKSLARPEVFAQCRPLVIGDAERLRQADRICATRVTIRSIRENDLERGEYEPGTVECVDLHLIPDDLPWGRLARQAGEAAFQYLSVAARLALEGKVAAICTAPLNKEALQAAGHKFPGHTELLAHLTGTPEVSMMLVTPKLRVLHVTTHIGLIDAIAKIEPGLVERTIARGHAALQKSGIADPRIGVCGINPHAGENGLFGYGEEEQKIAPAIEACCRRGWNVEGPLPADTLFYRAQRGDFDLVIAMYHDQGHGPVKVLGLESGVNITIGLPVVRTSVDHGTAFDIAGTGKADERSLMEALRQAVDLAPKISG